MHMACSGQAQADAQGCGPSPSGLWPPCDSGGRAAIGFHCIPRWQQCLAPRPQASIPVAGVHLEEHAVADGAETPKPVKASWIGDRKPDVVRGFSKTVDEDPDVLYARL